MPHHATHSTAQHGTAQHSAFDIWEGGKAADPHAVLCMASGALSSSTIPNPEASWGCPALRFSLSTSHSSPSGYTGVASDRHTTVPSASMSCTVEVHQAFCQKPYMPKHTVISPRNLTPNCTNITCSSGKSCIHQSKRMQAREQRVLAMPSEYGLQSSGLCKELTEPSARFCEETGSGCTAQSN